MQIFKRRAGKREWKKWFEKVAETAIKCFLLLLMPVPATIACCTFWYYVLFVRHIHFHEELKDIAVSGWIPILGILYSLLAAVILNAVFSEYKSMRMAIKNYDLATFMNLRDEDVSPVIHALMTVLAVALLAIFMGLKYPNAVSGLAVVGGTTYILALLYWIVKEIDNPFSGIWFIKNVHEGWLEIDSREWRKKNYITRSKQYYVSKKRIVVIEKVSSTYDKKIV